LREVNDLERREFHGLVYIVLPLNPRRVPLERPRPVMMHTGADPKSASVER
jgi:hypothetical protein